MKAIFCVAFLVFALATVSFADNSTSANDEWTANVIETARNEREKKERNDSLLKAGYEHGCTSGNFVAGNIIGHAFTKNTRLYIEEPYYKAGWDDGFVHCKSIVDTFNPFRK